MNWPCVVLMDAMGRADVEARLLHLPGAGLGGFLPAAFSCRNVSGTPGVARSIGGHGEAFLAVLVRHLLAAIVDIFLRSEEHTSELQSLMRISYAVFCLKKKKT